MPDICPKCGLPKELCVCNILDKETEGKIKVYLKKAKFDKYLTIVGGIGTSDIDRTAKNLKRVLACGGTTRDGLIELQGEHKNAVKKALVGMGYKEQNIDLS